VCKQGRATLTPPPINRADANKDLNAKDRALKATESERKKKPLPFVTSFAKLEWAKEILGKCPVPSTLRLVYSLLFFE